MDPHDSSRPAFDGSPTGPTAALAAAVAAGGAVGAALRAAIDVALPSSPLAAPAAALVVNVLGAFALGACGPLLAEDAPERPMRRAALAVGLCGGYTTFSSLAAALWALGLAGAPAALAVTFGATLLGLLAVALGARLAARAGRNAGPAALALLPLSAIGLCAWRGVAPPLTGLVLVAAGGGLGAFLRAAAWVLGSRRGLGRAHVTLVVNLVACLALGVVIARAAPGSRALLLLGPGLLGGLSTFSSLAAESLAKVEAGRPDAAAFDVLVSLTAGPLLVAAGVALAA